ncbi:MAG: hypothetical protein CM1200mP4_1160 [Rhodospirillaceae bacterium]|nr:MAG: hypothetical protein CM1200mP4_1160 [Rhodospirillaceae bacterium]
MGFDEAPNNFVSPTPGPWELNRTEGIFVEQVIRPTGLLDPVCDVRPAASQVDDLLEECRQSVALGPSACDDAYQKDGGKI